MTILVIDIGSSSARALLYALHDQKLALIPDSIISITHEMQHEPVGAATLDPQTLRHNVEQLLDQVVQHPAATDIQAVAMASFVGNVLAVDADNQPLSPIYTYADTRNHESVALLRDHIDANAAKQRTGTPLHTAYLPARLHWLKATQPDLFNATDRWLDLATYLYTCWFGESACSYSVASWSGLLNRASLTWDAQWLDDLALDAKSLPTLNDYAKYKSGLQSPYAERWKPLANIPFYLAIGDGAAANIGSGCTTPDHIALTIGTTAALRIVTPTPPENLPNGLWSYRVSADQHLIGGATSEGGNIFAWAKNTLNLPDDADQQLATRQPDQHGLTLLPLFAGERSPGWTSHASGTIAGVRFSTTPLDMLHAALEGVAHRLALIAEELKTITDAKTIIASGGALSASPVWAQIIANAINLPVHIIDEPELTARGAAILVAQQHYNRSMSKLSESLIKTTLQPKPDHVVKLRAARERQIDLYQHIHPFWLQNT